jgi:tetratricopeptide (TPR) repeat protein
MDSARTTAAERQADEQADLAQPTHLVGRTDWLREPTREALGGTGLLLLLPLAAFVAGYGFWSRSEPVLGRDDARGRLAKAISTLPGRDGQWWLDDEQTYFLLPSVRAGLAKQVEQSSADELGDALQLVSRDAPPRDAGSGALFEQLQAWSMDEITGMLNRGGHREVFGIPKRVFEALHPRAVDAPRFVDTLRAALDDVPNDDTAINRHLRALLLHKLALYQPKPGADAEGKARFEKNWDLAEQEYAAALALYPWYEVELRAICHADLARLLNSRQKLVPAISRFQTARSLIQDNSPTATPIQYFVVDCLTCEADAYRKDGSWAKAGDALLDATRLAQAPRWVAHVQERRGWYLMYRWKVLEARNCFREAIRLRADDRPPHELDPQAQLLIFHDRHGIAMAERYLGNVEAAAEEYERIIDELRQSLDRDEYEGRLLNTLERRADCELYGRPRGGDAVKWLKIALEMADEFELLEDRNWRRLAQLMYKLSLAHVLTGEIDGAKRSFESVAELLPEADHSPQLLAYRQIVAACLDEQAVSERHGAGSEPARSSGPGVRLFTTIKRQYILLSAKHLVSRDELDLFLLAARMLPPGEKRNLHARLIVKLARVPQMEAGDRSAAAIDDQTTADVSASAGLLAYLKMSYDTAIRLVLSREALETSPDWLLAAQFISESCEGYGSYKAGPNLALYFEPDVTHAILVEDSRVSHHLLAGVTPSSVEGWLQGGSFPDAHLDTQLRDRRENAIVTACRTETAMTVRFARGSQQTEDTKQ